MTVRLWDVAETAEYLSVSPKTVRRLAAVLGGSKVGGSLRFRQADIDHYVDQRRLLPERGVMPLARRRAI